MLFHSVKAYSRSIFSRSLSNASVQAISLKSQETEVTVKARRRRFDAEYKLRIVREADACTQPGEIGALLRREGLYSSHLTTWRSEIARRELVALAPLTSCHDSLASSLRMMSQRFCMSRPQHELATVKFRSTRCRPTEHPSKYSGV